MSGCVRRGLRCGRRASEGGGGGGWRLAVGGWQLAVGVLGRRVEARGGAASCGLQSTSEGPEDHHAETATGRQSKQSKKRTFVSGNSSVCGSAAGNLHTFPRPEVSGASMYNGMQLQLQQPVSAPMSCSSAHCSGEACYRLRHGTSSNRELSQHRETWPIHSDLFVPSPRGQQIPYSQPAYTPNGPLAVSAPAATTRPVLHQDMLRT